MGDKSSLKKRELERTRFARERGRHEQLRDGEKRNYEERVTRNGCETEERVSRIG